MAEKITSQKSISEYYGGLDKKEKGKFLLWCRVVLELSASTVLARMSTGKWRRIEREKIEEAIADGSWMVT